MRLSELLRALPPELAPSELRGGDAVIRGICVDSRRVAPGDLFVALRGSSVDAHAYLGEAARLGAAALLVEEARADAPADRPLVRVADTRRALAPLAARFYGHPADELVLVGVTGTNGKTSTTFLIESILAAAGHRTGLVGTVEIRWPGVRQRTLNTTPESLELQRTLRAMRNDGVSHCAMEVSSHGVALGRIQGCRFAAGAFTNLTQDHLDFHGSMDAYRAAKADFFRRHLRAGAAAVLNADDPAAAAFAAAAQAAGARLTRVSRDPAGGAEVALESAELGLGGTRARLRLPSGALEVALPLVGDFNLENLLVAVGVAAALGVAPEAIAAGAAACPQVPGRVERVGAELLGAPTVLVDYAHTPDAVEKLLRTLRPLARGRLVTVFGCGGDRDRSKRPLMAEAAARWSDLVVATSDNPRSEDPAAILREVEAGLAALRRVEPDQLAGAARAYAVLIDRREAIDRAIGAAGPGDMVVLAGKGHEDYQIVGRERLPFDDRLEARAALERRRAA
jgi:UDP-N-acetylmuramoyl-L-alanyl-D-glutamate--2,6-diaminopimelate ligase